jgi:DNA/RNA endonuclease YhcR with UshA esterase domain
VGQTATVCGEVASTKYDAHLRSQPTFFDFGKPYPNQVFTAVIFGSDRAKFGTPETTLQAKHVCVTGQVRNYRVKPEIIVSDPSQLTE